MIRRPPSTSALPWTADLLPLLDVIFIVLVFFLLTAQPPWRDLPLALAPGDPRLAAAERKPMQRELLLQADGQWRLDGQWVGPGRDLRRALTGTGEATQAWQLLADAEAPAGELLHFLSWARAQGQSQVVMVLEAVHESE